MAFRKHLDTSESDSRMRGVVDDRAADGVFRVSPAAYTDREILDLELAHIFEKTWSFIGLESQLKNPHDFITNQIGRAPILVTRDANGKIGAFYNVCRHKGAVVCRAEQGNAKLHVCPYHHWTYRSDGSLNAIKDKSQGGYPDGFLDRDLGLRPVAKVATYNGLIFGSLSDEVPSLDEFLGDMRFFIDVLMDQSPSGMEALPGRAPYQFRGNWKLQTDNGLDIYHLSSTHVSLINLQNRKQNAGLDGKTARATDWAKRFEVEYHYFNFPHGHAGFFTEPADPEKSPLWDSRHELTKRLGEVKTNLMLGGLQLHIFPNLQLATSAVPIIRKIHPVSVDETRMEVICLGAIGEAPEQRSLRLRQFEDFFNATGLATPDDSIVYEDSQRGLTAGVGFVDGFSRGLTMLGEGANAQARFYGINPQQSLSATAKTWPEVCLLAPWREWDRLLNAGESGEKAYA